MDTDTKNRLRLLLRQLAAQLDEPGATDGDLSELQATLAEKHSDLDAEALEALTRHVAGLTRAQDCEETALSFYRRCAAEATRLA
jgi:hypothetical protein